MGKYLKEKFAIIGIFFLVFLALEISTFLMIFGELPVYLFLDISIFFYIGAFVLVIGSPKVEVILALFFEVVVAVICFVNANMIDATGEIFSWDMLSLIPEATKVLGRSFIQQYACIVIYISIIALGFLAQRKICLRNKEVNIRDEKMVNILKTHIFILLFCFLVGLGVNRLQVSKLKVYSDKLKNGDDKYLYETLYIKQDAYKKFGTLGYYALDASTTILSKFEDKTTVKKEIKDYLDNAADTSNFATGISKGNNVIYILFETGDFSAINKTIMPNLYSLLTGIEDKDNNTLPPALLFTEFYAKSQTNISEAQMLFGSYPLKGIMNFDYDDNNYCYGLPRMYRSANPNAKLYSFHNNDGDYYNRNISHEHYGFDAHVDASEMDLEKGSSWINKDSEMFASCLETGSRYNGVTPTMLSEEFFTFIATFSTHGPFDYRSEYEENGYYDFVTEYIESIGGHYTDFIGDDVCFDGLTPEEYVKTYLAGAYDFDKGLGMLFDEMREKDLFENTTIVLMADHYAYYQDYASTIKGISPEIVAEPKIYNVPAIIFDTKLVSTIIGNTGLKRGGSGAYLENGSCVKYVKYNDDYFLTYDKFITNYDMCSTFLNLLGIPYNERNYFGYDVFSSEESFVFSRWGGFFNNEFYTNDALNVVNINQLYYDYMELEEEGVLYYGLSMEELENLLEERRIAYDSILSLSEYYYLKPRINDFVSKASAFLTRIDMVNDIYRTDYYGE